MKRDVLVYRPAGKAVFYANFRVRVNDPMRGVVSKQINRSTGSADRRTAQTIGNKMRDQAVLGFWDAVPTLRRAHATCGEIADRYVERAQIKTAWDVSRVFLKVVAEGAGLGVGEDAVAKARAMSAGALTAAAMVRFRDGSLAAGRTPEGTNTMMRTARSIFSRRAMEWLADMSLPDVGPWKRVALAKAVADKRFRRIPEKVLGRLDRRAEAAWRLAVRKGSDRLRNAWAVYVLMRRCGLRNSECEDLRWEWIVRRDGRAWIDLGPHGDWKPKGSAGEVPVDPALLDRLAERMGTGPREGHVLLGKPYTRRDAAHRDVNEIVRRYLPDREKGAYELRKQWGSEMARRHGIETAAKLLRHASIQTAWDHYYDDLKLAGVAAL